MRNYSRRLPWATQGREALVLKVFVQWRWGRAYHPEQKGRNQNCGPSSHWMLTTAAKLHGHAPCSLFLPSFLDLAGGQIHFKTTRTHHIFSLQWVYTIYVTKFISKPARTGISTAKKYFTPIRVIFIEWYSFFTVFISCYIINQKTQNQFPL